MNRSWNPDSRIHYGCDYNPEQWDSEVRLQDIELMRAAGVTMATVGVFSWSTLEPRPGALDLSFLHATIDALVEAGIDVCLATPSASAPRWFFDAHPDALAVTSDGIRRSTGSRTNHCPSSPELRAQSRRLAAALAAEFGQHPAVRLWHVGNEYGSQGCWCDRCGAEFRAFVRDRYGTLDALNAAWGTVVWSMPFSDWSEIMAPRDTVDFQGPGLMLDWKRFVSHQQLQNYLGEKAELERLEVLAPITTNFMGLYRGLDYAQWAPHCEPIANDSYPDPGEPQAARDQAFNADLMRSLGDGRPFVQMEQVTSAVQWRARNVAKRPGQFQLWSIQTVARGADAVCQFQWRQSPFGPELLHGAMVPHAGTDSRVWEEVVELGGTLGALGSLAGGRVRATVAIHLDWEAIWARDLIPGLDNADPVDAIRAWHSTFFERGIVTDFVFSDSSWAHYDLVIVPAAFSMTTELGRRIEEYVAGGGTVVAGPLAGVVDEHGRAHLGGYISTAAPIFGVRVREHHPLPVAPVVVEIWEHVSSAIAVAAPSVHTLLATPDATRASPVLTFDGLVEDLESLHAEVLSVFADGDLAGRPAITRTKVGSGAAWYIAGNLDAESRAVLVERLMTETGVRPTLAAVPPGVEAIRRGDLMIVLNHTDSPTRVHVPDAWDQATDGAITLDLDVDRRGFAVVQVAPPKDRRHA